MNRKQILVTGASRGIGKACAIHFAKEGWHVFLNCRKSISELQATADFITKETSGSCEILPGDVGLFCHQIRSERSYPRTCKGTCAKQYPGQCDRLWCHRYRNERSSGCGRKSCPRRRNPCRTFRDTRRSRASRMAACKCPCLSYRADTGYGRRIYLTPTPRSCPTSHKV